MSVVSIKKFDYIDALRGIAILLVIIIHTSQYVIPSNDTVRRLMEDGDKGVQLFFIVSALTLCFSLESRKKKETKYILYFFIRRFFRIAPLFYLAVLFYRYPFDLQAVYYAPNGIKAWFYLSAATFTFGWHPETITSIVPGSWSIAAEFMFYLVLPLLFKLINSKNKAILFLISVCILNQFLSSYIYDFWIQRYPENQSYLVWGVWNYGFFNQLPVFSVGILLFYIFKENIFNNSKFTSFVYLVLFCFFYFAYAHYCSYNKLISEQVIYSIAFAFLIYSLANSRNLILVNPITIYIGKISYSMYFIHFTILSYMDGYNFLYLSRYGTWGTWIAILIVVFCTMIFATITYFLIEKTGIAIGYKLISRIEDSRLKKMSLEQNSN